jgi:hypothetical protein
MPTLANALLEGLKDHGAREIFGIPARQRATTVASA